LLKAYPGKSADTAKQAARDLMRDAAFGWHTWVWARLQSQTDGGAAYVYYFDQRPPYPADSRYSDVRGVPHAAELAYVFKHLDQQPLPWRPEDHALSDAIATYWTNFVKAGNPNGPGLPAWPAFTENNQQRMVFKNVPQAAPYVNQQQLRALDEYFAWRRTAATKR
jgi:para-nitrobenzyl esterase